MSLGHRPIRQRAATLLLLGTMAVALTGYVFGIRDPASPPADTRVSDIVAELAPPSSTTNVPPAQSYTQMRSDETGPTARWQPQWTHLTDDLDFQHCTTCHDPHTAQVQPSELAKVKSLEVRATRRAYNGAPPIIPHSVEQTDDAACFACHGQGLRVGDRVANRMSHGMLVNCLQCHAAPAPTILTDTTSPTVNGFAGTAAPQAAERAFPDAPPVIPHSTWMREACLSCHGGSAGWPGLEVSHRWRTNCLQCHATTSPLDLPPATDATLAATSPAP